MLEELAGRGKKENGERKRGFFSSLSFSFPPKKTNQQGKHREFHPLFCTLPFSSPTFRVGTNGIKVKEKGGRGMKERRPEISACHYGRRQKRKRKGGKKPPV